MFDVSGNPFGDDGILFISSKLQHNKTLSKIGLLGCGLTAKGSVSVYNITQLLHLILITTGAICISKVFMVKQSLQVLNVSKNNIGEDGINAIAGALSNSQISELDVSGCGITLTGARSLGSGLVVNQSVKRLLVHDNPITEEGARLIIKAAVDSGVCKKVVVDSFNIL